MNAVSESFGRAAAAYEAHAPVQVAMADWLAEWLPARREGPALEIGAGTGIFTRRAQPWGGDYVASDASAEMVARGRESRPELSWQQRRAERIGPGDWSWIVSSSMLQWVADPAAVLAGWRSALAREGRILAGFYVADTLPELSELLGGGDGPLEWRTHRAWREAFRAAGLELVRDEVSRRRFVYPSARALLRSLHGVGAAPHRLVPPARLLAWLRERGERPMEATWTFYRCEAGAAGAVNRSLAMN